MTTITMPLTTSLGGTFQSINKLSAMPNLNAVSATRADSAFAMSTIVAEMGSEHWSFPALRDASGMFVGTDFGSHPFYTHTWGMGNVTTLINFAHGASNVPSTIDVSAWQMQNLATLSGFFFSVNSPLLVLDLTLWSTPSLTFMSDAFSSLSNVILTGVHNLNVSHVTDMTNLFTGTPMTTNITLNTWDTRAAVLMTGAFQNCIGTSVNVAAWNVANVVSASSMFHTSNMNPDMTTWAWSSAVFVDNIIEQCYFSTPRQYSHFLNAFSPDLFLMSAIPGAPRNNTLTTTGNLPTRVLQGYDSTGSVSHGILTGPLSWTLVDAGLH